MNYYVYVIISLKTDHWYIGSTNNLPRRVEEHNSGNTKSTRGRGPWELKYSKGYETKEEAQRMERKIKSWKNKTRIATWFEREKEV